MADTEKKYVALVRAARERQEAAVAEKKKKEDDEAAARKRKFEIQVSSLERVVLPEIEVAKAELDEEGIQLYIVKKFDKNGDLSPKILISLSSDILPVTVARPVVTSKVFTFMSNESGEISVTCNHSNPKIMESIKKSDSPESKVSAAIALLVSDHFV